MASLEELVNIDGVAFACRFTGDGKCGDYKSKLSMSPDMADRAGDYISTVTMLFKTLAGSFTQLSGMSWVPQKTWTYTGGDWTVVAGQDYAVFCETNKTDMQALSQALAHREGEVRQSV